MIYITGDTHADFTRFSVDSFYEQKEMMNQNDNFVIICGDFGGVWDLVESKKEKWWLDWLENKPFTTLFVDGNHENFDRLYSYPTKEWNGGLVHEIRPHVLHLMRGQVFTIEDKKFFTFGGASSHDIQDGILDIDDPDINKKMKQMQSKGKYMYRIKGLSWWQQELPIEEEMQTGKYNLAKHENNVDFIISHSPSTSDLYLMGGKGLYESDILTNYLEEIKATTEYKRHFFGHMHVNRAINDKDICLYEQIVRIN
jgi:hypothetical protein